MKSISCDVLIAGGGFAGISAAVAAARNGADTILLEKQCVLGGLATSGLVTIYLPLCDGRGHQVSFGIAEELFRLSIRHVIQDKNPIPWLNDGTLEEKAKIRYEVQFNPVYFQLETEELLRALGVRIFYDTRLTDTVTRGNTIEAVQVASADGLSLIHAKAFVDATGDACLSRLAGEETSVHPLGNNVAGWYYASTSDGLKLKMLGFADAPKGSERDGVAAGSGTRVMGDSAEAVNRYLELSHQATLKDLLKRQAEDERFLEPALMSSMPQFRMLRKIRGQVVMTETDDGVHMEDSVGMVSDWRKRGPRYEVPYGCLVGKTENLYAAGRIVSADDGMWDIMRVIPCCAVTGQAAGTAAAMTCVSGKRAETAPLQERLRQAGQKLFLKDIE